jgi:glycine betaine/proline transport system substrate-binding protein
MSGGRRNPAATERVAATLKGATVSLRDTFTGRLAVTVAVSALVLSACSSSGSTAPPPSIAQGPTPQTSAVAGTSTAPAKSNAPCGTVNIAENPWVGYQADAAVVAYILDKKLGCTVVKKPIDEVVSWQGFPTGQVDAILEVWGHKDLYAKYVTTDKTAVDVGPNGAQGVIGWFVPKTFADANPSILTAATNPSVLNTFAAQFKTSESGDKGQILDGDPSFVTEDAGIIAGLNLNYKVVYSGSEAASDKAIKAAIDQGKPILAYYYTPNWFSTQVDLVHVPLPAATPGCDTDQHKITCDYPPYDALYKVVSSKLATSGSPAFTVIKNFTWTNDDQNTVAAYIANDNMTDDAAAQKWVDANPTKWAAWMP